MNSFEDLLRRDLQASGERNAFAVDVDPVVANGHRTIRRRVLTTSALGLAAVVGLGGAWFLRPGTPQVAAPAPTVTPSVVSPVPSAPAETAPPSVSPTPSAPASSPSPATTSSVPAQPVDVARWASPSVDFASPTTRIACALRPGSVTCAIPMGFTSTVPEVDCVDGPGPATEVYLADGAPVYSCASDSAAFPTRSGGTGWMESGAGTWTDTPLLRQRRAGGDARLRQRPTFGRLNVQQRRDGRHLHQHRHRTLGEAQPPADRAALIGSGRCRDSPMERVSCCQGARADVDKLATFSTDSNTLF